MNLTPLESATFARIRQMLDVAESGHWELVGKTVGRRDEVTGRFDEDAHRVRGGWADEFPELPLRFGPKVTAKAIRRGRGRVFAQIVAAARDYVIAEGQVKKERRQYPVKPHRALMVTCQVCGVPHSRSAHRSHGKGGFVRSGHARKNPASYMPLIYGRVLRVYAKKTQQHRCDAGCKEVHHRYYHDFKSGPDMYGLPANTKILLPDGTELMLPFRSLLVTQTIRTKGWPH